MRIRLFFAILAVMEAGRRKVLMCFERAKGRSYWEVWFRSPPLPGILPRRLTFTDSYKIRDLFLRYGASKLSEDIAAFDYAVGQGKGIVDLMLGPDQIAVLEAKKSSQGKASRARSDSE